MEKNMENEMEMWLACRFRIEGLRQGLAFKVSGFAVNRVKARLSNPKRKHPSYCWRILMWSRPLGTNRTESLDGTLNRKSLPSPSTSSGPGGSCWSHALGPKQAAGCLHTSELWPNEHIKSRVPTIMENKMETAIMGYMENYDNGF